MQYKALIQLLRRVEPAVSSFYAKDQIIRGITCDSRRVQPGFLFAALPGNRCDGAAFIPQAIEQGACAILSSRQPETSKIPTLVSHNPRRALGLLSAFFYGQPSLKLKTIGITGTNGKTTSASLISHILDHAEQPCATIGTLGCSFSGKQKAGNMTTPESPELQAWMAEICNNDQKALAMEVSSHALYYQRVSGINFDLALFTNLTQDHLDFHQTMEEYFQSKKRLLHYLKPRARVILNIDDPWLMRLSQELQNSALSFGFSEGAQIRASDLSMSLSGMRFKLRLAHDADHSQTEISSPLVGKYNALNILGAIGSCLSLGVDIQTIAEGIATFSGATGRLEPVFLPASANETGSHNNQTPKVFVDYAHTPDALEKVCQNIAQLAKNQNFVCVFGCGGDRDRSKRPLMAKSVKKYCNHMIITSDNPRSEDPSAIIEDILQGLDHKKVPTSQSQSFQSYEVEANRALAIEKALRYAGPNGIVLVAGKGHENYQEIQGVRHHFDDREEVQKALARIRGVSCV